MHWEPFRSKETVTVFKRDPEELCKWPVYFSHDVDFTEVLERSHLKSAFHFVPFHQCWCVLALLMFLSCFYVLSLKRQRQRTITFWKKRGNHKKTYSFWHKKGCSVSLIAELGITSKETGITEWLFLVFPSCTYLSQPIFSCTTGSWSNPKPYMVTSAIFITSSSENLDGCSCLEGSAMHSVQWPSWPLFCQPTMCEVRRRCLGMQGERDVPASTVLCICQEQTSLRRHTLYLQHSTINPLAISQCIIQRQRKGKKYETLLQELIQMLLMQ